MCVSERVRNREDKLSFPHAIPIPESNLFQGQDPRISCANDCEVASGVGCQNLSPTAFLAGQTDEQLGGVAHHMIVGEDESIRIDNNAAWVCLELGNC